MNRSCQGLDVLFAVLLAASPAGAVTERNMPSAGTVPTGIPIHLAAWSPRPFVDMALAAPELAACFMLSPGWWSTAAAPAAIPDEAALARALGAQLNGILESDGQPLSVVIAATENANPAAIVHGDTALVLQPKADLPDAVATARTLAPALLLARTRPAPYDTRCDEPLLMVGEAIAVAGSLTLVSLPPQLRPVHDWLEIKDASPPLEALAAQVLDPDTHWQTRRAMLVRMARVGGANPPLAAAAALVVEAFGDAGRARSQPFELLLAWKKAGGKQFPPMPRALRAALAKPLEAGMPTEKEADDRREVGWDALLRRVQTGEVPPSEIPPEAPPSLRLRAAANMRARGGQGLCQWLTAAPLASMRTGCRTEGEGGGLVFSRPGDGGFGVVWRSPRGDEAPIVTWPRWVLFPQVVPSTGDLWFIDPEGVWHLPLDGHTPPQLAASGSFRYLTVAPDGGAVATVRWPAGQAVVFQAAESKELGVDGKGGIAFVDADVLVASDGAKLALASLEGQVRADVFALPCCRCLAVARGAITAGVGAPCEPGLVRVALNERAATTLLRLAEGPLGLVALSGEAYVLGSAEGLWSWPGQGTPERIGAGLTPGPG